MVPMKLAVLASLFATAFAIALPVDGHTAKRFIYQKYNAEEKVDAALPSANEGPWRLFYEGDILGVLTSGGYFKN
ncbi:hypothetical protein EYR40_010615 [Pleurotus pulmonarius]|nr:hypothetical protein EYR40_010615 [Pleurotus pulmonarius]